jgi:hypothetical protein
MVLCFLSVCLSVCPSNSYSKSFMTLRTDQLLIAYNKTVLLSLSGLGVMFLLIPVNVIISMKQRTLQTQLMRYKDSRLKLMNEILNGMKVCTFLLSW